MNLLVDNLPTKIKINNKIYEINYDYKTAINILQACEDKSLTHEDKVFVIVNNLYKDEIDVEDYYEAVEKAVRFLDCNTKEQNKSTTDKRVYSFTKDGNYIFTGINQTHHIDLEQTPNLHWWKFVALFLDMGTDCFFSELIYYRKRKLEGKLTKEEKKKYKELKEILDLSEETEIEQDNQAKNDFLKEFYR